MPRPTDRPTDRQKKTPKSTGDCCKTNKNMQKMSLGVKGELTPFFFVPFWCHCVCRLADFEYIYIYIYINKKNYLPMPQRGPHRKMFLFIYVYIYIYLYDLWQGHLVFLFFQPSWNGVGLQSTFLKCFKSTTRGKRSRWWGCGLIMCTGVY